MNLDQQICSLELAKRLKELGIKQESLFCYYNQPDIDNNCYEEDLNDKQIIRLSSARLKCPISASPNCIISAFTVAELGEMIPPNNFNFYKNNAGYVFSLFGEPNIYDNNLASAMAKMLIHLIENKLMELK